MLLSGAIAGYVEEKLAASSGRPAPSTALYPLLHTGGPGEPLPRPGRGFPAADVLDVTVPAGLAFQQH